MQMSIESIATYQDAGISIWIKRERESELRVHTTKEEEAERWFDEEQVAQLNSAKVNTLILFIHLFALKKWSRSLLTNEERASISFDLGRARNVRLAVGCQPSLGSFYCNALCWTWHAVHLTWSRIWAWWRLLTSLTIPKDLSFQHMQLSGSRIRPYSSIADQARTVQFQFTW